MLFAAFQLAIWKETRQFLEFREMGSALFLTLVQFQL